MARRAFEVIDIVEILQHWHAGRPKSVVASSLGVDPKTVRKYVARAEAEGFVPGTDARARDEWAELVARWFPELIDKRERSRTFVAIDAYRPLIEEMLATNTPTTVHQRLRDEHDLSVGISSFRRYVISEFTEAVGADKVTVLRPEVPMGEEVQIDYGYLGQWVDPATGKQRRVWGFVMVLAASRHMFVRPVLKMDAGSWVAANVAGLEFFGGVPRRLVIENVPRNIFDVLCPVALCGAPGVDPTAPLVNDPLVSVRAT
jgi:DNA-binding Lrp family transcriptional regulator